MENVLLINVTKPPRCPVQTGIVGYLRPAHSVHKTLLHLQKRKKLNLYSTFIISFIPLGNFKIYVVCPHLHVD